MNLCFWFGAGIVTFLDEDRASFDVTLVVIAFILSTASLKLDDIIYLLQKEEKE